ncbi:hypothetical protein POM88_052887 [Heracleum sosnowskyi]|uniref:Uncharacterized protein n=1 Tax=Heracleum sosnowskyi TaxID=360622 RepID=A0AAD8GRA3_9APIA|nr:hypothetical protein POM88_052887 [Heracleum sosnowskyi]
MQLSNSAKSQTHCTAVAEQQCLQVPPALQQWLQGCCSGYWLHCTKIKLKIRIFFITSSILDLTIVGLEVMDGDSSVQVLHPQYLKTCSKLSLYLGSVVYLLGYAEKRELTVGEGKVVIARDNFIKLSTDGVMWSPGSAGYDVHGNLAFMVCDPMAISA